MTTLKNLKVNKTAFLSRVQTDATLLAVTCCVRLHSLLNVCYMLLNVFGSCCAKYETGQAFSYVKTDATTARIVGHT